MIDKSPRKKTKVAAQNAVEYPCDAPPSNQYLSSEINAKRESIFSALFSLVFEHHVKFPFC